MLINIVFNWSIHSWFLSVSIDQYPFVLCRSHWDYIVFLSTCQSPHKSDFSRVYLDDVVCLYAVHVIIKREGFFSGVGYRNVYFFQFIFVHLWLWYILWQCVRVVLKDGKGSLSINTWSSACVLFYVLFFCRCVSPPPFPPFLLYFFVFPFPSVLLHGLPSTSTCAICDFPKLRTTKRASDLN